MDVTLSIRIRPHEKELQEKGAHPQTKSIYTKFKFKLVLFLNSVQELERLHFNQEFLVKIEFLRARKAHFCLIMQYVYIRKHRLNRNEHMHPLPLPYGQRTHKLTESLSYVVSLCK